MEDLQSTLKGLGISDEQVDKFLQAHQEEGYSFNAAAISADVKSKVIGQDSPIDAVIAYSDAWFHRLNALANGTDEDELPRMGSLLLMGPTASGKTYLVRTFCKSAGLDLTVVNGSTITGVGWRGRSLDSVLYPISLSQKANPHAICVVLIDEFDKMRMDQQTERECNSFNPQPNLLKLFDGREYTGCAEDSNHTIFTLDTSRILFIFAGAFTGIGKRFVAPRLRDEAYQFGEIVNEQAAELAYCDDECRLRNHVTAQDLLHWGILSELTGRIGTIVNLPALTENHLVDIVNNSPRSLQSRFQKIMPDSCALVIDDAAAHKLAHDALECGLGARALEGVLAPLVVRAMQECRANENAKRLTVTVAGKELRAEITYRNKRVNHKKG